MKICEVTNNQLNSSLNIELMGGFIVKSVKIYYVKSQKFVSNQYTFFFNFVSYKKNQLKTVSN